MTTYQKLVLRLLAVILWRLIHKDLLNSGHYRNLAAEHTKLIDSAHKEIERDESEGESW